MRATEKNRLQVLRRVRDFIKPMEQDSKFSAIIAELDATIERATAEVERQERLQRQAKSATVSIRGVAEELRGDLLVPLAKLVRKVGAGTQEDGKPIEVALALPRERDHEGLISASNAIHALATPHEERLVAAGLPKGHLGELQQAAATLKKAIDARAQDYLNRSHAGEQATIEGRNAASLLRLIDSLMQKQLRGNPAMRKAWRQAKRIGRSSGGAVEGGGGETPPVVVPVGGGTVPAVTPVVVPVVGASATVAEEVGKAA